MTQVWCSKRDCVHNRGYACLEKIIHLKFQEPEPFNENGQFVCKDYKEREE